MCIMALPPSRALQAADGGVHIALSMTYVHREEKEERRAHKQAQIGDRE